MVKHENHLCTPALARSFLQLYSTPLRPKGRLQSQAKRGVDDFGRNVPICCRMSSGRSANEIGIFLFRCYDTVLIVHPSIFFDYDMPTTQLVIRKVSKNGEGNEVIRLNVEVIPIID